MPLLFYRRFIEGTSKTKGCALNRLWDKIESAFVGVHRVGRGFRIYRTRNHFRKQKIIYALYSRQSYEMIIIWPAISRRYLAPKPASIEVLSMNGYLNALIYRRARPQRTTINRSTTNQLGFHDESTGIHYDIPSTTDEEDIYDSSTLCRNSSWAARLNSKRTGSNDHL